MRSATVPHTVPPGNPLVYFATYDAQRGVAARDALGSYWFIDHETGTLVALTNADTPSVHLQQRLPLRREAAVLDALHTGAYALVGWGGAV
jgi:hypothetical protein